MGTPKPCVFCQICEGSIPSSTIYEDDTFIVIMDAYPLSPGHTLVIPKSHYQHVHQLPPGDRERLFRLGLEIMEATKAAGFGSGDCNLLLNDGKDANQTVPHIHLHIIPRSKNDLLMAIPKLALHITGLFGIQTRRKTLDEHAQRIRSHCSIT